MIKLEIWKDIENYEGYYQVSNKGNVKSLERKVIEKNTGKVNIYKSRNLKKSYNKKGYEQVSLNKDNKKKTIFVHRLVASAFLENPNNLPQVNHKDGIKDNNNLDNLEWVTNAENMEHAHSTGLMKHIKMPSGKDHHMFGKTAYNKGKKMSEKQRQSMMKPILQIDMKTGEVVNEFSGAKEAADILGFSRRSITDTANGKQKSHKGFLWKKK